jgi:preprotein translocase subunit SecE
VLIRNRTPVDFRFGFPSCRMVAEVRGKVMAKYNPIEFFQEVREEAAKITWPTRKEVWITTVAVLIMVTVASLFFTAVDQLFGTLTAMVLGINR